MVFFKLIMVDVLLYSGKNQCSITGLKGLLFKRCSETDELKCHIIL
jgi:hypothetical protein